MSGTRTVIYRPSGPFATITIGATIAVAMLLSTSAAAILLLVVSLFAAGAVLASALLHRVPRSSEPGDPPRATWPLGKRNVPAPVAPPPDSAGPPVAAPYLPLNGYLEHRHSWNVVLTFEQLESLLGFPLPTPARTGEEWWMAGAGQIDGHPGTCALAGWTAIPNFSTSTVAFVRSS